MEAILFRMSVWHVHYICIYSFLFLFIYLAYSNGVMINEIEDI